jgi:hypothetical protein
MVLEAAHRLEDWHSNELMHQLAEILKQASFDISRMSKIEVYEMSGAANCVHFV